MLPGRFEPTPPTSMTPLDIFQRSTSTEAQSHSLYSAWNQGAPRNYYYRTLSRDPDNDSSLSAAAATTGGGDSNQAVAGGQQEEMDEEERLASLEALRYALHHAPFCRNMHTLMTVPNEECYEMIGIPTKCAIRAEQLSYKHLLENINIEVPKGKIYAVLGSGNNGKSVLLKLMLGRVKPTAGSVCVFGQNPSTSPLSAICVGYMPQRVALHVELTVQQTLHYYGRLYQLPAYVVSQRLAMLEAMFGELDAQKTRDRLVGQLDESQLWRLSLVVAMIHSPPLLLLDEPTDNVDPLVRSTVWTHLERLCDDEGLTIVFTTKHPEELSFAYKAGLMRDGHVYEEDRTEELLRQNRCQTFVQMYDRFCMANTPRRIRPSIAPYLAALSAMPPAQLSYQTTTGNTPGTATAKTAGQAASTSAGGGGSETASGSRRHPGDSPGSYSAGSELAHERLPLPMAEWPIAERRRTAYISHLFNLDLGRLRALVEKNLHVIRVNYLLILIFYYVFPALQIILVCFIFDRRAAHSLPVMVWTADRQSADSATDRLHKLAQFALDPDVFEPRLAPANWTLDQTVRLIERGHSWATIVPWTIEQPSIDGDGDTSSHEDENLCQRLLDRSQFRRSLMFGLRLYMDNSNYLINQQISYSLIDAMRQLLYDDDRLQELSPAKCPTLYLSMKGQSPIHIQEVLYGSTQFRFLAFLLPGFLVSLVFAYALVLTAYLFIKERLYGLQERCLTAGASGIEILTSHLLAQCLLFVLQELLLMIIVLKMFGLPSRGPLYALWLLVFLQGLCGIAFGLFVAVICPRPMAAGLFASAIFIPGFFFSGIVWPTESMPVPFSWISHLLPVTLPINALRYIISRGPDMNYGRIAAGYTVSVVYIIGLLSLTLFIFKYKTSS